jgi:hypothetical protein
MPPGHARSVAPVQRQQMSKKKNNEEGFSEHVESFADEPVHHAREETPARRKILPALSIGDILALLTLIVLSAALLLEGYHKEFKDYSKEIIALFAVVVGFLLGRKT